MYAGSALVRYSTANNEKTAHIDLSTGGKKFAWLQSYNLSDFDDLKMGSNYLSKYPNFGRRSFYVDRMNERDTVLKNEDDRIQKFSGYKQWDVMHKLLFKQNDKVTHLLNLQYSNSSDIPRYNRLQDLRNGEFRFAEWYYGPQLRQLVAYELNIDKQGFFNSIKTIISYQHLEESRHQRNFRSPLLQNRLEEINVFAATADARKLWLKNELTVGVDAQLNNVKSNAFTSNISSGNVLPLDSRYPDGENKMNLFGAYAQHLMKIKNGKIILNDGIRIQAVHLHSTIADNSFFNFPFSEIKQNNVAVTGNVGVVYMPQENTRLSTGLSSAFRSPNIDDAAKVFESNTASQQIIVPNPDIKPEYTYNVDYSLTQRLLKKVIFETTLFYTLFQNAISLAPYHFNGEDSIEYNGI